MGKESFTGLMVAAILASLTTTRSVVRASTNGLIYASITVHGQTIKWMESESLLGLTDASILESTRMTTSTAKEYSCGQMERSMKVSGAKASSMVKA